MLDWSSSRKKNKRGDYTGVPLDSGKLYYCTKEHKNNN